MPNVDELFKFSTNGGKVETVVMLDPNKISDFPNHPFRIEDNEEMEKMIESIRQIGVKLPVLVRPKKECTDTKHGISVGNSNKWFNSYNEAVKYYDELIKMYSNQVHNGEITSEEYYKLCPYGYETWSCPYCGKWTLNYYKR